MLTKIQELIEQIESFLSDKKGFSTELLNAGAIISVTSPSGVSVQYDGYELLLYTLASRKLGSDIKLNINTDTEGNEVFAVNTEATYNLPEYVYNLNNTNHGLPDGTLSVILSSQTSGSDFPYCVNTFFTKGTWLRYDLTMSELLYAAVHNLELEIQEDGSYAFSKLRENTRILQEELTKAMS